ncbi:flagellar basal body protein FliL (plasmid) [Paroceanicella profunda]|uniref:Flagellar protein FliL n=1 Tax=Paroceanicella profunda TaxID=2579971 RepID=A0A5B8FJV4_9RHOB|nr:flagellar basal body-associated FliL family protein [Paroceanicella profunda]QDL94758.1 flagellar basal body protein FliL [Paroceanicella profunda]
MSDATMDAEAVAEGASDADAAPKKKGKGLLIGLVAAVLFGAGGFYATFSGMVSLPFGGGEAGHAAPGEPVPEPLSPMAFLPLGDIVITLGAPAGARQLQFTSQVEVNPDYRADVELLQPRMLDVVNTYLRAVELRDLADPAAMGRIRAQLLRRIQIVTGEGRVRDLLITNFVLN